MPDFALLSAIALGAYNVGKYAAAKYKLAVAKKDELQDVLDGLKHVIALAKGTVAE